MKHLCCCLFLFLTVFSFAEDSLPERTLEGYRIIRIRPEETKAYKDSVYHAQHYVMDSVTHTEITVEEAKMRVVPLDWNLGLGITLGYMDLMSADYEIQDYRERSDTTGKFNGISFSVGIVAQIPIGVYNDVALRLGVLYEYSFSKNSESFLRREKDELVEERRDLEQTRLAIPMLLAFKGARWNVMFDIGAQVNIPLTASLGSENLIKKNLRSSVDFDLIFGMCVILADHFNLDLRWNVQMSESFNKDFAAHVYNFHSVGIVLGVSYLLF